MTVSCSQFATSPHVYFTVTYRCGDLQQLVFLCDLIPANTSGLPLHRPTNKQSSSFIYNTVQLFLALYYIWSPFLIFFSWCHCVGYNGTCIMSYYLIQKVIIIITKSKTTRIYVRKSGLQQLKVIKHMTKGKS